MSESFNASAIYIGIDAGTSGIRVCAIDAAAHILCELSQALPTPDNTTTCQAPAIWASAMFTLLSVLKTRIDRQHVKAMAIDGTSGTVLLTDSHGQPLSDALMYNDTSSHAQVEKLKTLCPELSITHSLSAGLPKILQLTEQVDQQTVHYIMHQADWLACQLTHQPGHSDINNCLKSGYDAQRRQWPACIKKLSPIDQWLPRVHQSGEDIALIDAGIAQQYGLPKQTVIRAGTTDSTAAVVATGAHQIGDAITSLGSTLVMKVISDKPLFNQEYGIYSQPFGSRWLVGGGSNSGGAVLRQYFTDQQMHEMSPHLDIRNDTNLHYYPLPKSGERFPVNDAQLAPRLSPRPEDDVVFFQGLLEGMAQIEYNAYQRLQELGAPYPQRIFSVGGGASNQQWTQIRQRYLQIDVRDSAHTSAAFGSALIARQQDIAKEGV